MNTLHKSMIGHGLIVMLIAMAAGFGLTASLLGGFEFIPGSIAQFEVPGDPGAWARAHAGGLMNGMMVILIAVTMHAMNTPDASARRIRWMLIGTAYANTIFYIGALFASNRALTFADNRFGESSLAAVIGLAPALIFAVISMIAIALLVKEAFRQQ